ncbi:transposase [Escherichia coli]|nr:transposase [Escherichia coli]
MEYRTWITEALRLHFEEHLPRVVAGRRLGVPKSTVCGMFVRFRNAGLSWPLPAGMSERELAKWHLNRSQFGIRIDHDLASISDHSLASQSITIWHASDH